MKNATSAEWAHREFGQARLKDARWLARLVSVAAQAARRPPGKVTEVFGNDAARQGAYGLRESEDVTGEQVGASMFEACAKRCAGEEFVFCAVDGSGVTVTDRNDDKDLGSIGTRKQGAHGVKVISALAITAKGVPVGLASPVHPTGIRAPPWRVARCRDCRSPSHGEAGHAGIHAQLGYVVPDESPVP
jgi:hypothetical protein